ncbi:YopX family protein [Lentilactobacillus otakiensis]|uniref:YopX family protein n=1 Tax=Lentilactobacillus otakiensis TaxID=481720 RepID=UPI003D171585
MNRQIKFRAWDSYQKRMLKVSRISFDGPIEGAQAHCYRGIILEQYTGLKDANGKEIYEGDILAWHSNIYRKHDWVGLVLYRGAGFAVQESDKSYSSPEWLDCACRKDANIIEVIGNIHEDEDLLEENWRQTNER